jgi:hypothetical protein
MTGITDCRKTDDTNSLWRRLLEHLMKVGKQRRSKQQCGNGTA